MTLSEIHVVMTGGYATIAGSLLGAYISFGVRTAPFGLLKTKNLKPTFVGAPHSSCSEHSGVFSHELHPEPGLL